METFSISVNSLIDNYDTAVISKFKKPTSPTITYTAKLDEINIEKTHLIFLNNINNINTTSKITKKLNKIMSLFTNEITSLDIISTPPR